MFGRSQKNETEMRAESLTRLRDQLNVAATRGIGRKIAVPVELQDEFEFRQVAANLRRSRMAARLAEAEREGAMSSQPRGCAPAAAEKARPLKARAGRRARATAAASSDREIMRFVNRELKKREDPRFVAAFTACARRGAVR